MVPIRQIAPTRLPDVGVGPVPVPGRPDVLADGLVRVTAPNPGMMTGPGTNTYVVGREEVAVVDPGPDDGGHRDAVLSVALELGRVRWVLVTHTHPDHAPGAAALAKATGATQVGFSAREGFVPDLEAGNGWSLVHGALTITALHTPGHASNHLCWVVDGLSSGRVVLTGDHLMQGSTVVIRPPDGDMAQYLKSLRTMGALDPPARIVAPGHGRFIGDPAAAVAAVLAHRAEREEVVAKALERSGSATVDQLLPVVYADVDQERLPVARFSLWAHLRKLAGEGRVAVDVADTLTNVPGRAPGNDPDAQLARGRWEWRG